MSASKHIIPVDQCGPPGYTISTTTGAITTSAVSVGYVPYAVETSGDRKARALEKRMRAIEDAIRFLKADNARMRDRLEELERAAPYTAIFVVQAIGPVEGFEGRIRAAFERFEGAEVDVRGDEAVVAIRLPRGRSQYSPGGLRKHIERFILPRIAPPASLALENFETDAEPTLEPRTPDGAGPPPGQAAPGAGG
jgi:hypothetical protein